MRTKKLSVRRHQRTSGRLERARAAALLHRAAFEPLEGRQLFSTITPGYPQISTDQTGTINYTYNATTSTGSYDLSATPFTYRQSATSGQNLILGTRAFQIHFKTDASGNVIGGVLGADFYVNGTIDTNNNFVADPGEPTGNLISGEIVEFNYQDAGTTDLYSFRFIPTGGYLFPSYTGQDIGVSMTSENSTFNGNFTQNFTGKVKAIVGPISPLDRTAVVTTTIHDSTGSITTAVLGESVYDTTSLTPSLPTIIPTGSVTYNFYSTLSPVYGVTPTISSETVTLNSDGSVPASSFTAPLGAGSYAYIAVYSGDAIYPQSVGAPEPLTINKGTLALTTDIHDAATGGAPTSTIGESVYDTYTLSGDQPFAFTGTVVYTFNTNPAGSGAQSVVEGPLGAGNYVFQAFSTGDSNYDIIPAAPEPLSINQASPAINTVAGNTVVIGSGDKLTDTAMLSGGYSPTGTITFTLTLNGNVVVDIETVSVNGNDTYSTPTGYLPTTAGSYLWSATYSGDVNNLSASDNSQNESETVTPAGPSISTTPGGTVTPGGQSISGTKYNDLTGNGFSSDDTPLAGVTINLYRESNSSSGLQTGSHGDVLVGTAVTAADGTYSIPVTSAGTYYTQEVVPTGYVQTGGGPNGTAGNTYYTTTVTAGHAYAGEDFDDFMIPTCMPINICYTVKHGYRTYTYSSLDGNTSPGDTVTVTFTVPSGMNDQLTLVSYYAPSSSWSDSTANQQLIYQQQTGIFTPGTHSLTVTIPNSYYQIDFVCGKAIDQFEPNQNGNAYGPDSSLITYHNENRFIDSDSGGSSVGNLNNQSPNVPSITSSIVATTPLTDTATLTGGVNPTGTITFYLFAPGVTPNGNYSNNIYTDVVPVNGNGTYSVANSGNHPGGYIASTAGTYQWVAVYGGDNNNAPITSPYGSEPEVVAYGAPAINTTPGNTVTIGSGSKLSDTAVLSGAYNPSGTITFTLFSPSNVAVYTDVVSVNGNGTYTTSAGNNPGGYLPTGVGTYQWVASYSGDTYNASVSGAVGDEPEVVNTTSPNLITTASLKAGCTSVIGSAIPEDSAVLSGSYNGTGTITFKLKAPNGSIVDTETVAVHGNGTYSTSNTAVATQTGTYTWTASYSGDTLNGAATDQGGSAEQITIIANTSISGTKYLDITGNGFSSDDTGLGGVTIQLYVDKNNSGAYNTGDTLYASVTTTSDGSYSFSNLPAGHYLVKEVVPTGYVRTGPALTDTYAVTVSTGDTKTGYDFDNAETCDLSDFCNVYYIINGHTKVTDLRGQTHQGDTVTAYFTYRGSENNHPVTLVSYDAPTATFDANNAYLQQIYQSKTILAQTGKSYSITVVIPDCYYQVDFVCGYAIDTFGPANSNIFFSPQNRLISADNGGTTACFCGTSSISGTVFADANNDGDIDANESGIKNVIVTLTGVNDLGQTVYATDTTDSDGFYQFTGLRDGKYTVTETQPTAYKDGKDSLGTVDGNTDGTLGNDVFSNVLISGGNQTGINYNFGEINNTPTAPSLDCNMTATIGFWQNKNGQALIKCLNGSSNSTKLGNWLASSFPNLFGNTNGCAANLSGKTNSSVASAFITLFNSRGTKIEAQIMATALSVYVTDSDLAGGTYARSYGFTVNTSGTGAATFNVGSDGSAIGLTNNKSYTIAQILAAANSSDILDASSSKQTAAADLFDNINNTGDI